VRLRSKYSATAMPAANAAASAIRTVIPENIALLLTLLVAAAKVLRKSALRS
jgi:hypothetical protein